MYIKYFFDLKKGDYIVYDKQYGTLIQIYENKISYEQLMTMLQLSNVDVTKIISVKAFSPSFEGFFEISKMFPLVVDEFIDSDEVITIVIRMKEEEIEERCKSTIKDLIKMSNDVKKMITDSNSKKEEKENFKNSNNEKEKITIEYMFSQPLISVDNKTIIPFNVKSNYDYEINIIYSLIKRNDSVRLNTEVLTDKTIIETISRKPKILFINSYGNYLNCKDKKAMYIENSNGNCILLHISQLNDNDFCNTELVILSNCHLCIGEEFIKIGVKNVIVIQSFVNQGDDDTIFIKILIKKILSGNSIKDSYEFALNKVNEFYKRNKNNIHSMNKYCYTHLHKDNCPILALFNKRYFDKLCEYIHNDSQCCCLDSKENMINRNCSKYFLLSKENNANTVIFDKEKNVLNKEKTNLNHKNLSSSHMNNNLLLYKILTNVGRLKIIYSSKIKGKHEFLNFLGKYLYERKMIRRPMVSITISSRELSEMLIINRISIALNFHKWETLLEFYTMLKNEKVLIVLYFYGIDNQNLNEMEKIFSNLTENTLMPSFIVSLDVTNEKELLNLTFPVFKFEGIDDTIAAMKEEVNDKILLNELIAEEKTKKKINKYIQNCPKQLKKFCFFCISLKKEKIILEGLKSNLFDFYLQYIEKKENKDKINKKDMIYILFILTFFPFGLEKENFALFIDSKDKKNTEHIIEILIKYKLIIKSNNSMFYCNKLFNNEIYSSYKDDYLESVIISLLWYLNIIFNRMMSILFMDPKLNINVLSEFSALYPPLLGNSITSKLQKKLSKPQTRTNFSSYYTTTNNNDNLLNFIFVGNKNLLTKILKKKGNNVKFRKIIENLSITIPSYYKYFNRYESLFWSEYFLELLLSNKMHSAYQKLLLFKYSIKKQSTNISFLDKSVSGKGLNELIFRYCYIITVYEETSDKSNVFLEKVFLKAMELKHQFEDIKLPEFELVLNTFLFKISIKCTSLNIYSKNLVPLLIDAKDIRMSYLILLLELQWAIMICNEERASQFIQKIKEIDKTNSLTKFESYDKKFKKLLNKLHLLRKSKYYNQIYILHANSSNKSEHCVGVINIITNFLKNKKEINFSYLPLTVKNIETTFSQYGKILIVFSEDIDNSNICIQTENKESKSLTYEEFKGRFTIDAINYDIVFLFITSANIDNYINFFTSKGVSNVISTKLDIHNLANAFLKVKMSLDFKIIFRSYALFIKKFLKKFLLGFSIKDSFDYAKTKIYHKLNSICQITNKSISFDITNIKENEIAFPF